MAVKARATVTISHLIDISAITRYYILQSSTAAAPAKPTTVPALIGKNHFVHNTNPTQTANTGLTCTFDSSDNTFTINGTLTAAGNVNVGSVFVRKTNIYTMSRYYISGSITPANGYQNLFSLFVKGSSISYIDPRLSQTSTNATSPIISKTLTTIPQDGEYVFYIQAFGVGTVFKNYKFKIQVELGSTATAYQKYVTPNWQLTEPAYTSGSTNTLYFTDCTEFTNGTFKYSDISKSSSYEAAKEAYNKAQNAQNTADSAKDYTDKMKTQYGYRYKYDITLNGDANTYYPLVIGFGDQDVMREIMVKRAYHEKCPTDWNGHPVTKGISLLLKLKCNFGGWGGANYSWWIHDFEEMYGHVFASAGLCMSYMGFYIFLRGGGETGALYHIYSDQTIEFASLAIHCNLPKVYYNSDRMGWNGGTEDNPTYSWNAPAPRTYTDAIKNEIQNKRYINLASDAHSRVISAETKIEQNKNAIELRATKTEMVEYIASRKENLVTNGSASLSDNTNFSSFEYDPVNQYYSNGSFRMISKYVTAGNDEFIPVDINQRYDLSYMIKSSSATAKYYDFLNMYDADKNLITDMYVVWTPGSTTTLAKDLKAGDTTVTLTSVAGFNTTTTRMQQKGLIFWNYKNSKGYQYPVETYSRFVYYDLWTDGSSVNTTTNVITLKKAWTGQTIPAGTSVSQSSSSGTYSYINGNYTLESANTWVKKTGSISGVAPQNANKHFREGTAFVRVYWLINYGATANATTWIANVNLTCNANSNDVNDIRDDLEDQGEHLRTRIDEAYASLETNAKSINASVEKLKTTFEENADSTNTAISELREKVNLQLTENAVDIQIDKKLQNGVNRVETSTGFKFDENGINVSKTGADTSTQITENGMKVLDVNETDPDQKTVLEANKDGVNAKNLRASTYLVIGGRSRLENYGAYRTGCFWIGPSSGLTYPVENATVLAEELKSENTELKQSLQDIKDGLDDIT